MQKKELNKSGLTNFHKSDHNVLVTTKTGIEERKVTIRLDTSMNYLKITLSDDSDIFFLYTTNLTHEDFLIIKSEQGLFINFADFPDQICNLLHQCDSKKMHLQITLANSSLYFLEFMERNDFKNLMHLQLKVGIYFTSHHIH